MHPLFDFFPDPVAVVRTGGALFLKGALLLGAALILAALLRRRSAALIHGILVSAFVLLLALPLLSVGLPAWNAPVVPPRLHFVLSPAEAPVPSPAASAAAPPATGLASSAAPAEAFDVPLAAPVGGAAESSRFAVSGSAAAALALGWTLVTLVLALRLLLQMTRVRRLTRSAAADPESEAAHLLPILRREAGTRREVRVLYAPRLSMPMTWNLLRPVILLPDEARRWPHARLAAVLRHELAHIARGDYAAVLLVEAACLLHWLNPLVWLARRRLLFAQECACDDRVLRTGCAAPDYADHLLAVARTLHPSPLPAAAMARTSDLKRRLRALLEHDRDRTPVRMAGLLPLAGLLTAAAFGLAALHPGPASQPAASPLPAPTDTIVAGPEAETAVYFWIEAEDGRLGAPMQIREDVDASGVRYVVVPDGRGNDAPEGGPGSVGFTVEAPRDGRYTLWARMIGDDGDDNSFYLAVDDRPEVRWDVVEPGRRGRVETWTWIPAPVPLDLSAGTHVLRIRNREDGTRLDRLMLTDDPAFVPEGRGPAPDRAPPVYRWLEAETTRLAEPFAASPDASASGGYFVGTPPRAERDGAGSATFVFEAPADGPYVVWGRVRAGGGDRNSFRVQIDDGAEIVWDVPEQRKGARAWRWDPLGARRHEGRRVDPLLFDLQAGRHVLTVRNREPGTQLDGLLVTSDLGYRPTGMRPPLPPAYPTVLRLEAEQAAVAAPFVRRVDSAASGGAYLAVAGVEASGRRPPETGRVRYRFHVGHAGAYTVWGRIAPVDDDADSFWVRVDDGRWIRWNGMEPGRRWHWDAVHDAANPDAPVRFDLEPGAHTLEVRYREPGARVDAWLLTDDPTFAPTGPDGGS